MRLPRRSAIIRGSALAATALITLALSPSALAAKPNFSASINGPPEVQRIGNSYLVVVNVRNRGGWIAKFCLDFGDANNSWKIVMPGMRAYDGDTFCYGTLKGGKKQFVARIIPAKPGQKKLELCLGHAVIYPDVNDALIDENGLCWSDTFVLA